MTTKRIGRPPNEAGHTHRTIGISGTEHEIAAVLELTPRQRMEAMLATIQSGLVSASEGPPMCGYCGTRHYGYQDHELA